MGHPTLTFCICKKASRENLKKQPKRLAKVKQIGVIHGKHKRAT